MRSSAVAFLVSSCLPCLALACGKSSDTAGSAGSAGRLGADSNVAGSAAGALNGGASSGDASSGGAGSTSAGGQTAVAGSTSAGLLECDPSKVLCKRTAPQCVFGEVPQVVASCYGECVKVDRCACSTAAQCPQPEQYTCWSMSHCGPFVN